MGVSEVVPGPFRGKFVADTLDVPDNPPVTIPSPPKMHALGTTSKLAESLKPGNKEKQQKLRDNASKRRDVLEERGEGDRWSEIQKHLMLAVDQTLVGYNIEMLFEYPNDVEGGTYLDWAHGVVKEVKNEKTNRVLIEWNQSCLGRLDKKESFQKLLVTKWNPKQNTGKGTRREYL